MHPRLLITTLFLAGMPMVALACSPTLISPQDALQSPGPTARYSRIVLAEVIASRAPARSAELEQWRRDVRAVAAAQKEENAREAERARIDAATPGRGRTADLRRRLSRPGAGVRTRGLRGSPALSALALSPNIT